MGMPLLCQDILWQRKTKEPLYKAGRLGERLLRKPLCLRIADAGDLVLRNGIGSRQGGQ